jgi:hypothetical protein
VVGGGASRAVVQKKTLRASEQDRPDVVARRRIWQAAQRFVDPDKLVFIDETGASTKMTRLYGRAPRGRRLFAKAPFGHWKTTTFVAALRRDGLGAPMVLDGPMTGLCRAGADSHTQARRHRRAGQPAGPQDRRRARRHRERARNSFCCRPTRPI